MADLDLHTVTQKLDNYTIAENYYIKPQPILTEEVKNSE
jgi:hypothetical protein